MEEIEIQTNINQETDLVKLSILLGTNEITLRLLISIFMGYPIAIIHRYVFRNTNPNLQHIFFILSGLAIGYFNFGSTVLHSVLTILVVHLILLLTGGTALSVFLGCLFLFSYLTFGYVLTTTDSYDINWTLPQCMLTIKLIGLLLDVCDGMKPQEELSESQKDSAVRRIPKMLEMAGHALFPLCYLVGPTFPIRRYRSFVQNSLSPTKVPELPKCSCIALKRAFVGCVYLMAYQASQIQLPDDYLLTEDFEKHPFLLKCILIGLWGQFSLYKYVAIWLFSEGSCIASGIAYNGISVDGEQLWNGCANVNLYVFEFAHKFEHYIASFNIQTNQWVLKYVYKRFKFLNNRYLSQIMALLFLSGWHGLHTGYFMCFCLEFFVVKFERDMTLIFKENKMLSSLFESSIMKRLSCLLLKLFVLVFMGYCLVPFVLLSYPRWCAVYKSVYFVGHAVFIPWFIYGPIVKFLLIPKSDFHTQ